ncbi:tyrosine--tRNA ligase [Candidatus Curtissbacteria bacterium RIFCSPLOWO2_01_FULL_42_26]|uniref:Tyrosine--tRNA ligase n=1 Tax=Candidatus Curtissbacteria bacterium RIFCSPLOWO2_01_FULL_42_26 TaxID=1797729 RepID=A0A1F5HXM6_9BACT|nr:MAG: tyrosine--tRNA ligase [Candidatus Curtissbacteria bacterium RIFCSPLOWO2_01_FULL_42_26]
MDKVDELLSRGVKEVLPDKDALAKLMQKRKIKVYLGIDPSNPQIHLGNAVALRKLAQFQQLGHKVILLIGDFTGMIGDPTDKSATRKKLTKEEVEQNAKTYKEQAAKILRFDGPSAAEIKFNSQWLDKLSSRDWIELISNFTEQQLDERDMYVARKKEGKPVFMHELVYPIMQGYDSVAMDVDLEVGGTDQTFNMLVGRHLMKTLKNKEKFVLTVPLLIGADGQKMGKSTGNFIPIDDKPADMFGKIMSIRDDLLQQYFELGTDVDPKSVDLSKPMAAKKKLAYEIVKIYHGEKAAKAAQQEFESVHQKGSAPENLNISVKENISLIEAVSTLVSSKSQAKRLIDQGAVEIDGQVVREGKIKTKKGQVLKVGKKTYAKVGE